jgi:hypothetical protein
VLLAIAAAGALLQTAQPPQRRRADRRDVLAGAGELLLFRLFGGVGRFPFHVQQLLPALIFVALGVATTTGVPAARPLRGFFVIYLVVLVAAYLIPSGIGSNIDRIRYVALPLALIASTLRQWRPLWLVVPAVALAAVWNTTPIAESMLRTTNDPESARAYWQPAIGYLHQHLSASYRVEAVDTADHWPAAYLPEAGIPIVRGWYRQADFPQNELLYDKQLGARTYDRWLRGLGVRYVVISDIAPDYSSRQEALLIRSGRSGLVPVFSARHIRIYELRTPRRSSPGRPVRASCGCTRRARCSTSTSRGRIALRCAGPRTGRRTRAAWRRGKMGWCGCTRRTPDSSSSASHSTCTPASTRSPVSSRPARAGSYHRAHGGVRRIPDRAARGARGPARLGP